MRGKGNPLDVKVEFTAQGYGQQRYSHPEPPHALAVQALKTLQRLMGNDHQAALLEILHHVHQLVAVIDHLHRWHQLQGHELTLPLLQPVNART